MTIKQLSVFIENKKGRLADITGLLGANDIDISALSLADTSGYGVLRLIVDNNEKAKRILTEAGIVVKITDVMAVVMNDEPGGCAKVLRLMSDNSIDIEYMYACAGRTSGKALMIFRVENCEKAQSVLASYGYAAEKPSDIFRV